jgi:sugar phosphate isomerase/epimerase
MKLGIDNYSFHRYFGLVYPGLQEDPGVTWDLLEDFLPYAVAQQVDEVALETLFLSVFDDGYCDEVRSALAAEGIEPILGWALPDGLSGALDEVAVEDMKRHIPQANKLGCRIMRIVASSMEYVDQPPEPRIAHAVRMLKPAIEVCEEHDIVLALENHIDFTGPQMRQILEGVGSERLGVNLDTGNPVRTYEDPVDCARRACAVHRCDSYEGHHRAA